MKTGELLVAPMTAHRMRTIPYLLLVLYAFSTSRVSAQTAPWTTPLRGSWVQTGPAAQGDIVLAAHDGTSQIVVGDDENAAVRQAAEFLAGDIEKISGHRPLARDWRHPRRVLAPAEWVGPARPPGVRLVSPESRPGSGHNPYVISQGRAQGGPLCISAPRGVGGPCRSGLWRGAGGLGKADGAGQACPAALRDLRRGGRGSHGSRCAGLRGRIPWREGAMDLRCGAQSGGVARPQQSGQGVSSGGPSRGGGRAIP